MVVLHEAASVWCKGEREWDGSLVTSRGRSGSSATTLSLRGLVSRFRWRSPQRVLCGTLKGTELILEKRTAEDWDIM